MVSGEALGRLRVTVLEMGPWEKQVSQVKMSAWCEECRAGPSEGMFPIYLSPRLVLAPGLRTLSAASLRTCFPSLLH